MVVFCCVCVIDLYVTMRCACRVGRSHTLSVYDDDDDDDGQYENR